MTTSREIELNLGRLLRSNNNFVVNHHYTPAGWYECDIADITQSLYLREYEIKISRSDYTRDFRTKCNKHKILQKEFNNKNNSKPHEYDPESYVTIPNRFCFVCSPEICSAKSEMPDYAGLINHIDGEFITIKQAPLIHKRKMSIRQALSMARNSNNRYWGLLK